MPEHLRDGVSVRQEGRVGSREDDGAAHPGARARVAVLAPHRAGLTSLVIRTVLLAAGVALLLTVSARPRGQRSRRACGGR